MINSFLLACGLRAGKLWVCSAWSTWLTQGWFCHEYIHTYSFMKIGEVFDTIFCVLAGFSQVAFQFIWNGVMNPGQRVSKMAVSTRYEQWCMGRGDHYRELINDTWMRNHVFQTTRFFPHVQVKTHTRFTLKLKRSRAAIWMSQYEEQHGNTKQHGAIGYNQFCNIFQKIPQWVQDAFGCTCHTHCKASFQDIMQARAITCDAIMTSGCALTGQMWA